jgi:hypothetical protein
LAQEARLALQGKAGKAAFRLLELKLTAAEVVAARPALQALPLVVAAV